jgi:PAS domain S-box-containing protein
MKKVFRLYLVWAILVLTSSHTFSQVSFSTLKAVMTFQFSEHIVWENEQSIKTFTIGVYGENDVLLDELRQIALKNKIKGKKVEVVKISNLSELRQINLLYVTKTGLNEIDVISSHIEKKNILLVTDAAQDSRFIMLNLIEDQSTTSLHFELNRANMIIENFTINPELLLLGGTEIDVRELYREMRSSLVSEQQKVKEQKELLVNQRSKIEKQQTELLIQSKKFEVLNENMIFLHVEITGHEKQLDQLSDSIVSNNEVLILKSQQINLQEGNLDKQRRQYDLQLKELENQRQAIVYNKKELEDLVGASERQQEIIDHQQEVLSNKDSVIETQEKSLYYSVFVGVILLLLGGSVFKAYYDKRKANVTLELAVDDRTKELSTSNNYLKEEIEERATIQDKLSESEKNYKEIYNATADSIVIYNKETGLLMNVNNSFSAMFGFQESEVLKLSINSILYGDGADKGLLSEKTTTKALQEGGQFEIKAQNKESKMFWADVTFNQTHIDNKLCVMAVIRDISQRKKVELQLRDYRDNLEVLVKDRTIELEHSKDLAESANQAKSSFLSNMSHELRTPLNAILGYAQILQIEHNITAKQKGNLSTIYTSGAHLLALINEILDFGKVESGKMEIKQDEFNLLELLHNVVNIISVKAEEKHLYLNFEADKGLPRIVVGDEQKIRQILLNLLSNAVKYNDEGGITFTIKKKYSTNILIFEVSDTGIGILEDQREAIFEPFVQVSNTKKFIEGTGLGLPITKKLIELLGGDIYLESEIDKGSVFTAELPIEIISSSEEIVHQQQIEIIGYKGERKKVLVIDDNSSNLFLIRDVLEPLGFEVELVDNGTEGVRRAMKTLPDLILLDYLMPDIDGYDVAVQTREKFPEVVIIGMSATVTQKGRKDSFTAVCNEFVLKPIDLKSLYNRIHMALGIEWEIRDTLSEVVDPENILIPVQGVLDKLSQYAHIGDFNHIELLLEKLMNEDTQFSGFCNKIKNSVKRYDSDEILNYLNESINPRK